MESVYIIHLMIGWTVYLGSNFLAQTLAQVMRDQKKLSSDSFIVNLLSPNKLNVAEAERRFIKFHRAILKLIGAVIFNAGIFGLLS